MKAMNSCMPVTRRFYCKTCRSLFSKTIGDCIGLKEWDIRCPYCLGRDFAPAEENAFKEVVDFLRNKLRKLFY